jgi:hypothetical protein
VPILAVEEVHIFFCNVEEVDKMVEMEIHHTILQLRKIG